MCHAAKKKVQTMLRKYEKSMKMQTTEYQHDDKLMQDSNSDAVDVSC